MTVQLAVDAAVLKLSSHPDFLHAKAFRRETEGFLSAQAGLTVAGKESPVQTRRGGDWICERNAYGEVEWRKAIDAGGQTGFGWKHVPAGGRELSRVPEEGRSERQTTLHHSVGTTRIREDNACRGAQPQAVSA